MVTTRKNSDKAFSPDSDLTVLKIQNVKIGLDYPMSTKQPRRRIVLASPEKSKWDRRHNLRYKKKRKAKRSRLSRLRRRARKSLAQRFVPASSRLDPSQILLARVGVPVDNGVALVTEKSSRAVRRTKLQELVGPLATSAARKRFIRISRAVLEELGCAVVGRIPMRMLEIIWDHLGERALAPHGINCWCRLCRGHTAVYTSAMENLGGALWYYVAKMPVRAIKDILLPAPLKVALFVSNKLWRWLKVIVGPSLPWETISDLVTDDERELLTAEEYWEVCISRAHKRNAQKSARGEQPSWFARMLGVTWHKPSVP